MDKTKKQKKTNEIIKNKNKNKNKKNHICFTLSLNSLAKIPLGSKCLKSFVLYVL